MEEMQKWNSRRKMEIMKMEMKSAMCRKMKKWGFPIPHFTALAHSDKWAHFSPCGEAARLIGLRN